MADVNWNLAVTPDPFKQIAEGANYSKQIFDQAALLKAGSQYAAGDPASAANTVAARGDFATAGKLQDYATNREAGNLYAGGDYSGAGKALARGGNITGAETLADKQIKTVEAQQNALGKVGGFLEASGGAPDAWDWAARSLQAVGVQPDTITKLQQQYATNPKQTVAQMKALANHKYTYEKTDDGVLRQFDESGNLTHTFGSEGGPYKGTGIEAQDSNIFVRAYKDPSVANSPEYALAYGRMTQQKPQFDLQSGKILWTGGTVPAWAPKPGSYQGGAPPPAASPPNEPPPSGTPSPTPTPVAPGATSRAEPIDPAPPPLSLDDMYKAVSKRDGIPEDTLRAWAKDPEEIQRLYAQPIGPATAAPQTAPSAAGAPPQGGPAPAASAQPGPGASNVRVADIPGLEPRQNYNPAGPIYGANGQLLGQGRWNDTAGEYEVQQPNGTWGKMPAGARVMPQNTGGPPSATAYNKLKLDFTTEQIALRQLDRYFANVGNLDTGLARLATQISANVKTAFGTGKLTPQELNRQLAAGEFQGLQGLFRTDIGGGGVLTGPDVDRVKAALGGDVNLLQNPQVVKVLLGQIYQDKRERLQTLKQEYDRAAPYYGEQGKEITVPETLGGNAKPQSSRGPYAPGRGPQYDLLKKYGIE